MVDEAAVTDSPPAPPPKDSSSSPVYKGVDPARYQGSRLRLPLSREAPLNSRRPLPPVPVRTTERMQSEPGPSEPIRATSLPAFREKSELLRDLGVVPSRSPSAPSHLGVRPLPHIPGHQVQSYPSPATVLSPLMGVFPSSLPLPSPVVQNLENNLSPPSPKVTPLPETALTEEHHHPDIVTPLNQIPNMLPPLSPSKSGVVDTGPLRIRHRPQLKLTITSENTIPQLLTQSNSSITMSPPSTSSPMVIPTPQSVERARRLGSRRTPPSATFQLRRRAIRHPAIVSTQSSQRILEEPSIALDPAQESDSWVHVVDEAPFSVAISGNTPKVFAKAC
ncbi:hypothetical protein BJ138DRAFT_290026 [Hygrophoropsis aurantiaca]|uniref:Uncharacterized protein n=1 Tax=Hygrophoropsis aurantiaca TaxID=72124 RepID=A0ACB8ASX7_9AGAM|nr:hypothetical protein BJ138DRAFT_290026 [Hygrophoropsis aurantiaca]